MPVVLEFGEAAAHVVVSDAVDDLTGVVVYTVEGRDASGCVTFSPEMVVGRTAIRDIVVVSGICDKGAFAAERECRLRVHGAELDFRHWLHPASREFELGLELFEERNNIDEAPLPSAVEKYSAAIIEHLIGMWLGRSDTDHLMYVANLARASDRYHRELAAIGQLRSTIVDLDQEVIESQERAGLFASQASEYQHIIHTLHETRSRC